MCNLCPLQETGTWRPTLHVHKHHPQQQSNNHIQQSSMANTLITLRPLLNKRHIPNERRHPPWKSPRERHPPMAIYTKTMPMPCETLTAHPCHRHHLPGENTLHHPKLVPTIYWIHILPRLQSWMASFRVLYTFIFHYRLYVLAPSILLLCQQVKYVGTSNSIENLDRGIKLRILSFK